MMGKTFATGESPMSYEDAVRELKLIDKRITEACAAIDWKRSWRPSERAVIKASFIRESEALKVAIHACEMAAKAVVVALAVWTATPDVARADVATRTCFGSGSTRTCVWTSGPSGNPHVIAVPGPQTAEDVAAAEERAARWEERCRPVETTDRYGMTRYAYALPGCEYGAGQ